MGRPMGLGVIGTSNNLVFKRKFRWTFTVKCCAGTVPEHFVKLASRPNISIEETEINFLNAKTWIPGKGTWETISVTYYDVGGTDAVGMLPLYGWLTSVYDFAHPLTLGQSSRPGNGGYGGIGTLTMYDGCGTTMEEWTLNQLWPQAINFGELDYSSSEEATIELTLRYSNVAYVNRCPGGATACPCVGC